MEILRFSSFLLILTCVGAEFYTDCGPDGTLVSVTIAGCDESGCSFQRGSNVSTTLHFKSKEPSETVKIDISAKLGGVLTVPWPGLDTDACHHMTCPIEANKENTFDTVFEVKKVYPPIKVPVTLKMLNSAGETIVCIEFPVKIKL